MNSLQLLDRLIAFPTVSRDSNLELIGFVRGYLESLGARCRLVFNSERTKANLFASVGPPNSPGVLLSGHTDVVPVDGQDWTSDPFRLTRIGDRLYGRGTADMKGFLACALSAAAAASGCRLTIPLWLAFSYDEELGCIGVRRLIDVMVEDGLQPLFCIVGEPTSLAVATGHKGKTSLQAICRGKAAHTAFAPRAVNALHLACDFVGALRRVQTEILAEGASDPEFEVPCTTLHAAGISGGIAANIVPDRSVVDFEIRNIAADRPSGLIERLTRDAVAIVAATGVPETDAGIRLQIINDYPGLATDADNWAVTFVRSLAGSNSSCKVAFGTEAGLFAERVRTPAVICGPGSMEQGHKADEFISYRQMQRCDAMLAELVKHLESGSIPTG
ncbi:MAG: acetylornithine deacetylase [Rhodobacteraceae bacterium]|nr:acetylornithine deacetylase [Paracoccaceae bacterium]